MPDVYWFEADHTDGTSWTSKKLDINPSIPATAHKNPQGWRIAQLKGGGKPEIVIEAGDENQNSSGIYVIEIPSDPNVLNVTWPSIRITTEGGDGVAVADVDGDYDLDIVTGAYDIKWYKNPGYLVEGLQGYYVGSTDTQDGRSVPTDHPDDKVTSDRISIADVDGDMRPDLVVTEETYPHPDDFPTYAYWFKNPEDSENGTWEKNYVAHDVAHGDDDNYHGLQSMEAVDMDNDGDIDIVLGEHKIAKRIFVFENDGKGNFLKHQIGSGYESHGLSVADIDNDGDKDISHIGWDDYQHLYLCVNQNTLSSFITPIWNGPQPVSIYKEYVLVPTIPDDKWRVTDPNATYECGPDDPLNCPAVFLPNPTFSIYDADLSNAIRAETYLSRWGGHTGTVGHQVSFNTNPWRDIPIDLAGISDGHDPECYNYEDLISIEIPLIIPVLGEGYDTLPKTPRCRDYLTSCCGT